MRPCTATKKQPSLAATGKKPVIFEIITQKYHRDITIKIKMYKINYEATHNTCNSSTLFHKIIQSQKFHLDA